MKIEREKRNRRGRKGLEKMGKLRTALMNKMESARLKRMID